MRRFVFLVPLFVIVSVGGFSLGISFPQEAKAQAGISLDVFPGDQSDGWAYMTCGWYDGARYTHSDRPQDWFYVWGNSGWYYQANYAAKTIAVANEIPGCSTTGAHLHQTAAYYWTRNGGAFPNAPTAEWRWVWDHPMHWTGW